MAPMGMTLKQVAELVEGELLADGAVTISGVGPIEEAKGDQIAALDGERFLEAARRSKAAALLVPPALAPKLDRPRIVVRFPQIAQNRVIERLGLWTLPWSGRGRHPTAIVDAGAQVADDVSIGPYAVVGPGARIGAGSRLDPHAVVEGGATIGARCHVHSHAVIGAPATIGDDCTIGRGAVLAGEGFGFGFGPTGAVRLRHLGRVVLGNRVEIGSHATLDRARFGDTRLGDDVKIDSQVHLGHNVVVGARTILAAQTGVAGSTEIGENCLFGGQVGVGDHLKIANGVRIAAKSGVSCDLEKPGDYYGSWAKERRVGLREVSALGRLPEALKEIERLRREVAELRGGPSEPTATS
jgi:UDP-3-O-[3-hydroxymyristoyl] glucosamine N-acyltransferase